MKREGESSARIRQNFAKARQKVRERNGVSQLAVAEFEKWRAAQLREGDPDLDIYLVENAFFSGFKAGIAALEKGK